jgi:hypothetical protein
MELIIATHCWQVINKLAHITALLAMKHNAVKQSTKLITSLHSKHYWPSGILIHWQNSYAPCRRQYIGHHEAQCRKPANKGKNFPLCTFFWQGMSDNKRYTFVWRGESAYVHHFQEWGILGKRHLHSGKSNRFNRPTENEQLERTWKQKLVKQNRTFNYIYCNFATQQVKTAQWGVKPLKLNMHLPNEIHLTLLSSHVRNVIGLFKDYLLTSYQLQHSGNHRVKP